MTDAIVATAAFLVLALVPGPHWQRLKVLPDWQRLRPVMTAARIICPLCFLLLCAASLTGTAQGLAERALATGTVLDRRPRRHLDPRLGACNPRRTDL